MSQYVVDVNDAAPVPEDADPSVNEAPAKFATTSREAVVRRRRIEEVIERKRAAVYGGDYDFDIGG